MVQSRPTVVLSMIVKNEESVIEQCLSSVVNVIDTYCIVDTGSSDNTIDVIQAFFGAAGKTGVVEQRPWVNFGHNRSEALELARSMGDYAFVMDADDILRGQPDFTSLDRDGYMIEIRLGSTSYWRYQLFSSRCPWRYEGVVHEFATCGTVQPGSRLIGDWWIEARTAGARSSDRDKYRRDAELLRQEVDKNPNDSRSMFYLGQSLYDCGDHGAAAVAYARRIAMGGWEEEVFFAKYRLGLCLMAMNKPRGEVIEALLDAWEYRPTRAEPLYQLSHWSREQGLFRQAHLFATQASRVRRSQKDGLFIAEDVYGWRIMDELAVSAYHVGEFGETLKLCVQLLRGSIVPEEHRDRIRRNLELANSALSERSNKRMEK